VAQRGFRSHWHWCSPDLCFLWSWRSACGWRGGGRRAMAHWKAS